MSAILTCNSRSVRTPALVLLLLLLLTPIGPAFAQPAAQEPLVPEKIGKDFHARRITGAPPRIDGLLDDEVWTEAQAIDDMVQNEPDNMAPPRDGTIGTFFLVWNMARLDDARAGRFALGRDLGDAFTGPGSHVLIAKFSYWLRL